ncbi:MAG: FAD-binding oxidoreductase [Pseudomonas sp.]|uniref:FAD-binding oxidoreductase n=1 Tax=Pseudomonas sp. TaxID=306 RepID=UPI003391DA93
MRLHGWGRYPVIDDVTLDSPTTLSTARRLLLSEGSLIGRGMGRSYGDSALHTRVASTQQLQHLLAFDPLLGTLRCQAGVTLDQLLAVLVPRGWFLPVTPGTRFVSVGGAVASDVHGKNHHLHGCFSEFVDELLLGMADGSLLTCSRDQHPELFYATCGGMGLTGLILEVSLRLTPIRSAHISQTTFKAANLEEVLQLFDAQQQRTYSVAWIDCLARGADLGRSLLMVGEHAGGGSLLLPEKRSLSLPLDMPAMLLNPLSVQAFNSLYYQRIRQKKSKQRVDYQSFFYPLDGIQQWNRMYGRQGFLQYQFVIPKAAGVTGLRGILERIAASHRGSFLAVLKVFGEQNRNPLSFPLEGYTLALDFKYDPGLFALLDDLDARVLEQGGRIYLTKDARMSEQTFKRSYPGWEALQAARAQYGAHGKFTSRQAQRLGLD